MLSFYELLYLKFCSDILMKLEYELVVLESYKIPILG